MTPQEFEEIYKKIGDGRSKKEKGERQVFEPKNLWQRHHEILNRYFLGWSESEIARELGCTTAVVSYTVNSEIGKKKLELMRMEGDVEVIEVKKEIEKLYPKALEVYKQILNDRNAGYKIQKETADTILMDIGGHAAPKQIQAAVAYLNADDIKAMKERGMTELARLKEGGGEVIDYQEIEVG